MQAKSVFVFDNIEFAHLKSHTVTSSGGALRRVTPFIFTEEGGRNLSAPSNSRHS